MPDNDTISGDGEVSTAQRLRILTYYRKNNNPNWLSRVDLHEPLALDVEKHWRKDIPLACRLWREVIWTWRLLRLSKKYDVILTGSERIGLFFGVAQRFFRRRRIPHIYLNFFIYQKGGRIGWALRRFVCRRAAEGANYVLVHRRAEIREYSLALGLPTSKFCFVPDHTTVADEGFDISDDGYIFSGGDANRDYRTLIEAVRGAPYRLLIVCYQKCHLAGVKVPENVEIIPPVPKQRFQGLVLHARLVVVPLKDRLLHVGGRQTYLDAMRVGKPVIVADLGATDYVTNGFDGILTAPGDVSAMRYSIKKVMEDREFAESLGRRAKETALGFTPEKYFSAVLGLCSRCAR